MHYKTQTLFILAASLLPTAFAQTHSLCNPLKGCFQDDPALGGTYTYDFTKKHAAPPMFDIVSSASRITYEGDGMHMAVQMKGDSPTLQSQFYIFWGKIEFVMKAGPGQGIISSLVFQSDDLDEIDIEFVGSQPGNVQTNIFSKGNQEVHIYGGNHPVADATGTFHTYTVDWNPTSITWLIDGAPVRVLNRADLGDAYPQTPMQIKFGPWAAGDPSNAPGTIDWAGGPIDYSKGPFDMVVQSLTIIDYSTGASKYRYKDGSGSSESIEIVGGGGVHVGTTAAAPPSKPTTTSTPPPPPPKTTTKPPPPPPSTTSTSTSEEPTTSSAPPSTTSKSTSSKPPPTTSSRPSSSAAPSSTKSTFTVVETSQTAEPTETTAPEATTFETSISLSSPTEAIPATTSSPPPNSGAGVVRLGWSMAIIAVGTFLLL